MNTNISAETLLTPTPVTVPEISEYRDPWQEAEVLQYFDTLNDNGTLETGLLDDMKLQVARLLDLPGSLKHMSFASLLADQADDEARQKLIETVESRGDIFDDSLLKRVRCCFYGQQVTHVIIRAISADINPRDTLGGWQAGIQNITDTLVRSGVRKNAYIRVERSRVEQLGNLAIVAETSITDASSAHY